MPVELLAVTDPVWQDFVCRRPEATVFHHPAWSALLADCYGYRLQAAVVTAPDGQIIAGVPVAEVRRPLGRPRWVALPFTDSCPPLGPAPALRELAAGLAAQARGLTVDVRGDLPEAGRVRSYVAGLTHVLALEPDACRVAERFSKMHQRNIRKAEKCGVQVVQGATMADVAMFYRLHVLTRRRLGVPVQPYHFFEVLAQRVLAPGLGFVVTAMVEDRPVASALMLAWNGTLIYKFGASDAAHWELRPNNLLFAAAIRWACENGCHTFDFGRTDLDDAGLAAFKRGWGADERPLRYARIGGRGRAGVPQPGPGRITRWLGAVIRHAPEIVCRALGEAFYRFAA